MAIFVILNKIENKNGLRVIELNIRVSFKNVKRKNMSNYPAHVTLANTTKKHKRYMAKKGCVELSHPPYPSTFWHGDIRKRGALVDAYQLKENRTNKKCKRAIWRTVIDEISHA